MTDYKWREHWQDRIVVGSQGYTWQDIVNLNGKWSATRTGEYKPCKTGGGV